MNVHGQEQDALALRRRLPTAADVHGWTLVSGDHEDIAEPGLAIAPADALAAG